MFDRRPSRRAEIPAFHRRGTWLALLAGLILAFMVPPSASAQERTPLLMEDKETLFQRVLSRPNAVLRSQPVSTASETNARVPTFTVFYVFDRKVVDGVEWLEVGQPARGPTEGWVRADQAIDWKQSMVVAFSNPSGRDRTLMFQDRQSLIDLLESELLLPQSRELRQQAVDGTLPVDTPVISIEPAEYIDITQQFYLLPILEAETAWLASGFTSRILEVASVPLNSSPMISDAPSQEDALSDFKVGIVFVIDTTISMGPYIDRTREVVRRISERIGDSDIAERVSFGMVAYRDNTEIAPELGYTTRTYAPLQVDQPVDAFLTQIGDVAPAESSSRGFNEDAIAGLVEAIALPTWTEFGGRYIILISDAGPRAGNDPYATTGLGPSEVNQLADGRGIATYTLHLLSEAGTPNHDYARQAYREISAFSDDVNLYFDVQAGSVDRFGQVVDTLTDSLISQVQASVAGELLQRDVSGEDSIVDQTQLVGRAMQLAYLGRQRGTQAPDVFEAWLADRDFTDPRRAALEVRVLLTKNELSDLTDVLNAVLEAGESAATSPDEFFGQLRSAVARLANDPSAVIDADNLGDLLGEYLEDLPYQSQLMEIDEQTWLSMSPGAQREVLDNIRYKLRLYRRLHDQVDLWVALYDGAPEGETVYPVPLDALP